MATDTAIGTTSVSVLLSTRHREDDMARLLPTLLDNEYPSLEVILIDQGENDLTERVVVDAVAAAGERGQEWELVILDDAAARMGGPPATDSRRLVYRRTDAVGACRGWNEAFRYCHGDLLAFTDDDCTVPGDWIALGAQVMDREPAAGMLFGDFDPIPHDPSESYIPSFHPETYRWLKGKAARLQCDYVASGNMFVRRSVFEALGGFDELLGPGAPFRGGDDVDLAYRALRAGFDIVLDPDNSVLHWGKREYAGGAGRQILRDYYYAVGARQIKQIRCGDVLALYAFARSFVREGFITIGNAIRYRRLTGAGRQLSLLKGAFRGFRQRLDRKRWVYVD